MTLELKHPASVAGLLISLFAGLVAALLWLMPKPYTRFEYMIAGSAGTAFTLLVGFLVLIPGVTSTLRRLFRTHVRRVPRPGTDAAEPSVNPPADRSADLAANRSADPRTVRRSEQSS